MLGINWKPNIVQLHKNLGMIGAFVSAATSILSVAAPVVVAAAPIATPVVGVASALLALTGMVAHQVDDASQKIAGALTAAPAASSASDSAQLGG